MFLVFVYDTLSVVRVIRSANRIGESFGYMVKISVIQKKKKRDRKASISIGYS